MIAIIGATGFTGKLIAEELLRANLPFFIAGRNLEKLKSLCGELGGIEFRRIDVEERSSLQELAGCNVIINCAGPFTDLGAIVVEEAIRRRIHYLDLTGEQSFIKLVYEKYHKQAFQSDIALVPACAFEYAIGDAAGDLFCAQTHNKCRSAQIVYEIAGIHTSPGTRKSIIRAMTAPTYQLRDGKASLVEAEAGTVKINGMMKSVISFPGGEPLMLPRHTGLRNVTAYMTSKIPAGLLQLVQVSKPLLKVTADLIVNKLISSKTPTEEQRKNSRFRISVVTNEFDSEGGITVSGSDPYFLTAVIAAGAAQYLLRNGPCKTGAITPAMINGANFICKLTETEGVEWSSF